MASLMATLMASLMACLIRYSDGNPYGYQREALSGIVQTLLITKHMLFVGFSLTDDAFNQVSALDWLALTDDASHQNLSH